MTVHRPGCPNITAHIAARLSDAGPGLESFADEIVAEWEAEDLQRDLDLARERARRDIEEDERETARLDALAAELAADPAFRVWSGGYYADMRAAGRGELLR